MKKVVGILAIAIILIIVLLYISVGSTSKKQDTCHILNFSQIDTVNFKNYKTVTVSASNLYEAGFIKKLMQGENYRDAWNTPVKTPILFLDTLYGGIQILKEGGGHQTQSLRLQANNGIIYTLRSINKNPAPLIPEFAKTLGLQNIVIDGISSQHPYAAPVVAELANNAKILHTHPKMFFVPKQESLKEYNDNYGNRLYYLEYENKGSVNWTTIDSIFTIIDTEDLQELKMKSRKNLHIHKPTLIRARLFDLIIGDWDRHAKQWGWAVQKINEKYTAYPIATDRDNAFFKMDGFVPSIISNKNVLEQLRPFDEKIEHIDGLVYDFDVYFLYQTSEIEFIQQAQKLQELLTDEAIEKAFSVWNEELYKHDGASIIHKIKTRRDNLINISKRFKRAIDKKPLLNSPLKGCERKDVDENLLKCFEC
ncbi:hypothetical protein [Tenacibaculum sp. IB213877]|uniref:hypothetical protein n=1 Tax=Tenacibaculum sp. IB213877 TaxID=3097351 RepID=UPI002A5AAD75|nr:hypothetical protein [Tenacibaculum sp. IB213877]MDY0779333.1 hypothetical protein [Tenacibaculum sp. IB213877]